MIVRPAGVDDLQGYMELARPVEHWFGSMVDSEGFVSSLERHVRRRRALVAVSPGDPDLLGGVLYGANPPIYEVHWLVVAQRARRQGIGRFLVQEALRRVVTGPGVVEVVTFGSDHPGANESGARTFYDRLGFDPAEPAPRGPEGGSRQVYRKAVR